MKKYSLIVIALIFSLSVSASKGDSEKIYKKLKSESDAFSMSFSKEMIDFFDMDIDFNGKEKWVSGDFAEGKMMVIKESFSGSDINKMFKQEGFELIDLEDDTEGDVNIENGEVNLYVNRTGNKVSEVHFVIEGEDNVILFSVFGTMKVSNKK